MFLKNNLTFRVLLYIAFVNLTWSTDESQPAYGDGWLYFMNDNGTKFIMNFSSIPNDTQDMLLGEAYFYLYTRNNIEQAELMTIPDKNKKPIESTYFNKSNEVKVISHGWLSSERVNWVQKMKNSLIREYDLNVVTVDWSELSQNIVYPFAAFSTRYVGQRVAKLLDVLMETYNITGRNFHLIGHSLGAQIMGYAGMFSKENIYRISGLDPARPLFEIPIMPPDFRLDINDADFVDILHTCGGVYGYRESYGHTDFYPNNGKPTQPGCNGVRQVTTDACSHGRSHEYFEESIEYKYKKGFVAYPCASWEQFDKGECKENSTVMGYYASVESRGNYYLRTRNESKFADDTD